MQSLLYIFISPKPKVFASYSINAKFPESSVQKIIIDLDIINHFF